MSQVRGIELFLVGLAAVAAGAVNALAGGGTLITFPVLTALGVPAVVANITNTVALSPGYLGATLAQSKDLRGQKHRLWLALPAGTIGGIIGAVLLLNTGEKLFRVLVPFPFSWPRVCSPYRTRFVPGSGAAPARRGQGQVPKAGQPCRSAWLPSMVAISARG